MAKRKPTAERILCFADPHFTSDPRDEYRWDLWPQLEKVCSKYKVHSAALLGDMTEKKDNHDARLVDRLTQQLYSFAGGLTGRLFLLRGNHDGIDEECPYFRFTGLLDDIVYVDKPLEINDFPKPIMFLPHSRHPLEDWKDLDLTDKLVMTHITVNGAITETGFKLGTSLPASFFDKSWRTLSGDIHKPQDLKNLTYVGSPYNVRFGDNFDGRVAIVDLAKSSIEYVALDFPRKFTFDVTCKEDLEVQLKSAPVVKQATVKLRIHIDPHNMGERERIKSECIDMIAAKGWSLAPVEMPVDLSLKEQIRVSPEQRRFLDFEEFCTRKQIDSRLVKIGKKVVEEIP